MSSCAITRDSSFPIANLNKGKLFCYTDDLCGDMTAYHTLLV